MKFEAKIVKKYFVGDEVFGGISTEYEIDCDGHKMTFTEGRDIDEEEALHLFKMDSLQTSLKWGGWNRFWKMIDLPEEYWFMPICEDDYMEDPENPEKHDIRTLGYNAPKEMEVQHTLLPFINEHLDPEVWISYYIQLDKNIFCLSEEEKAKLLVPLEEEELKQNSVLETEDVLSFLKMKGLIREGILND